MSFLENLSAKLPFRKKDDYEEEELFETLSPEDQEIQDEFLTGEDSSSGWEDSSGITEEDTREIPILDAEIEPPKKKRGLPALLSRFSRPKSMKPAAPKPKQEKPSMKSGKPQQILLLLILLVLLAILGFFIFGGKKQASQPAAPAKTTEQASSESDTSYAPTDRMFINPFVDRSQLSNIAKDSNGNLDINASHNTVSAQRTGSLPAIPGGSYSSNPVYANVPRMGALPAIPSVVSPSSVPSVSRPSAPPASAPSHASSSVSGVMTGGDGNGMAILSDGTVLSAGDTYNDGRIAYIGGDGIHFDDGSTMKYGE